MKLKIKNRVIEKDGTVFLHENAVIDSLFRDPSDITNLISKDKEIVAEYNKWAKIFDMQPLSMTKIIEHDINSKKWKMPLKYKNLHIEKYILNLCVDNLQRNRCEMELKLYKNRNLYDLLRFLIYFVDTIKENNVILGIGRGSSVSSYCLFKIGLHKVDSLKYNLDITEFLK